MHAIIAKRVSFGNASMALKPSPAIAMDWVVTVLPIHAILSLLLSTAITPEHYAKKTVSFINALPVQNPSSMIAAV
jgi:hypothetical protein